MSARAAEHDIVVRRPDPARIEEEALAAMRVQRAAMRHALPGLREPHSAARDREWIRGVFARHSVWLACVGSDVVGIASRHGDWLHQLYVAPGYMGRGIGQRLLDRALAEQPALQLWTFSRNEGARRFYERNGFVAVEFGDGSGNEECEADVRYVKGPLASAAPSREK
ncbi:MAG TPA: GNAT family N-acetyltransferase [Casimicrobiaceae bacterium]|nr:GNAT family N-acetyltransferase [Casimicrobiaceae bacterium]